MGSRSSSATTQPTPTPHSPWAAATSRSSRLQLIADGELERVVVDRERFLASVP
jgi:hypothetical protein